MRGIKITNPAKNISLEFLTPAVYGERFKEYGVWVAEDLITRDYIAKQEGVFILFGWDGFGKVPDFKDIRNTLINTHGSQRVSGFSEELEFTLRTEVYLYCENYKSENLYNILMSCFLSEYTDLIVEFDLGCRKVYQYYSFQTQEPTLGSITFKGTRGGNCYYLAGGDKFSFPLSGSIIPFEVPVEIGPVTSSDRKLSNVIGIPSGSETFYQHNVLLKTLYTLKIKPDNPSLIDNKIQFVTITVNGVSVKFDQPLKSITKTFNGKFLDENNQEIKPISIGGKPGRLPMELEVGIVAIKVEIQYKKGKYTCYVDLKEAGTYV